jgi:ABC-type transporter Mla subunit MlaD
MADAGAQLARQLAEQYQTILDLSHTLRRAVEQGQTASVERLLAERGAAVQAAARLVEQALQDAAQVAPEARRRLVKLLGQIEQEDAALQALLAARRQELITQLEQVRASRARLAGSPPRHPDAPRLIDRRG